MSTQNAMCVLVTGSSGHVGRMICQFFKKDGIEVQEFDAMRGPVVRFLRMRALGRDRGGGASIFAKAYHKVAAGVEKALAAAKLLRPTGDDILAPPADLARRFEGVVVHLAALSAAFATRKAVKELGYFPTTNGDYQAFSLMW